MSDSSDPVAFYKERTTLLKTESERWSARSRQVGNFRGLSFAVLVIAFGYFIAERADLALAIGIVATIAFFFFILHHGKVVEGEERSLRLLLVAEQAHKRATGAFAELPKTGARFVSQEHPFSADLDVFGPGSLYQRLSVAHTRFGEATLASFLGQFASPETARQRQEAVRELTKEVLFRQELEAESLALTELRRGGKTVAAESPDPEPLLAFIEGKENVSDRVWIVWLSWLIPLGTVAGGLSQLLRGTSPLYWLAPWLLGLALLGKTGKLTTRAFAAVSTTEGAFLRYGRMFALLESFPAQAALLADSKAALTSQTGEKVSRLLARFQTIVGYFDFRHSGMVYPAVNSVLLWDIHCTLRLEAWRRPIGTRARSWFQILGDWEALSSFAGFAFDETTAATFPTFVPTGAPLKAERLGHPLIAKKKRVTNDVEGFASGEALLVTGSNMSGKSTFLRALGVNLVLGYAGAPVIAQHLELPPCELRTSIRMSDSLQSGTSHFYAEVKKLARVAAEAKPGHPTFFLLDEILHGTNSRERQIGARWVLARLLEQGAFGVVTTHDEGLCELSPEMMKKVRQHHFKESVEDGAMTFDYELRTGPVKSGNALRLMRMVGLDVPLAEES